MTTDQGIGRREMLASLGALGAGAAIIGMTGSARGQAGAPAGAVIDLGGWDAVTGTFKLPALPYAFDALEPHIDAKTMEIHYTKHHQGYVNGLNKALEQLAALRANKADAGAIKFWAREVSFHGSGHVNHTLFWRMMAPVGSGGGGDPTGTLLDAIVRDFGSVDAFRWNFTEAAAGVEGGGWAWVVREPLSGRLEIIQGEKQQNLMVTGSAPIMGIDVWEHAYYLKHQNRRTDYIKDWWNVVNWGFAQSMFDAAGA